MFGWFKRTRPKYTTFTIKILPNDLDISVDWDDPKKYKPEELQEMAKQIVRLTLAITNNGPAINEFQSAIGRTAQLREDQKFSNMIFYYFKQNFQSPLKEDDDSNELLSSPDKVLQEFS